MQIKDKKIGHLVDVAYKRCTSASCYWPRPDPGSFTQGAGYSSREREIRGWLCGTREINGCPYKKPCPVCGTKHAEPAETCSKCNYSFLNADLERKKEGKRIARAAKRSEKANLFRSRSTQG